MASDFLVNINVAGAQYEPQVTVLGNGNYVVVWTSACGLESTGFAAVRPSTDVADWETTHSGLWARIYDSTDAATTPNDLPLAVSGSNELRVKAQLDFETASSHAASVVATDGINETTETITIGVQDMADTGLGMITIDASGSASIHLEAFITGGFIDGETGGGFPSFDNSTAFSGEEMFIGYGTDPASKYVLAHGTLTYGFSTHTIHGEINTIEYGTRGDGGFDSNGYYVGGNSLLKITGLDFSNPLPTSPAEEADIEANGLVHLFGIAHMYGDSSDPTTAARVQAALEKIYAGLGAYAQTYLGTAGVDTYTGTAFDDITTGGGGNDELDGGAGEDIAVFSGVRSGYGWSVGSDGVLTVTGADGTDRLTGYEKLQFDDVTVSLDSGSTVPSAADDTASTVKDLQKVIDVLANDADSDGTLDPTTVTIVEGPLNGTVTVNATTGAITYKPTTGYVGADSFTYTVKDNDGEVSNTATVTLTVAAAHILTGADEVFSGDSLGLRFSGIEVHGGGGHDYIVTSNSAAHPDTIYGDDGNDLIFVGGGNDFVDGGAGDDVIHARAGTDTVIGGAGDDTFVIRFTDAGTTTITDTDGALWHGTFRPASFPGSWTPVPGATSGYGISGNATFVSDGVWDLAVTDNLGVVQHLTLSWTGGDLTMTNGSNPQAVVIEDYVRGTFGITLENSPPTNVALSSTSVAENSANGAVVGTFSASDMEGDSLTYTLTEDAGGKFSLFDDNGVIKLVVAGALNFESVASYQIEVEVSGGGTHTTTKTFTIGVSDVNEAPSAPTFSATAIPETLVAGSVVGTLAATDPEGGAVTWELTDDGDGLFVLDGNQIKLTRAIGNFEAATDLSHAFTVVAKDAAGNATAPKTFTLQHADAFDSPEGTLTIDASGAGAAGVNFTSFFATWFAATSGNSDYNFYGGAADSVFGTTDYLNGEQIAFKYGSGSQRLVLGGDELAYDFFHSGAAFGHGISGGFDSLTFGNWIDGTTTATEGIDEGGLIQGLAELVRISGFDLDAAPGTGSNADLNLVHAMWNAAQNRDVAALQGVLANYAQNFKGSSGNDVFIGSKFADTIDGNGGLDILLGGLGDDSYTVGTAASIIVENDGEGTDTIRSQVSFVLGSNIERLELLGTADNSGTGNELANIIIGNAGANMIDGKGGADSLRGGAGNDIYVVDVAGDAIVELANHGTDTVRSLASHTLAANVENLLLFGGAAVNGTGNAGVNDLTGNAAANILDGKGGADVMRGGLGNDGYFVDHAGDQAIELAGQGTDTLTSSLATTTLGANLENLVLIGAAITGNGNAVANSLTGNAAANVLDGKAGADVMRGAAGNDTYFVDAVGDSIVELANQGIDTVRSTASHVLAANVEKLVLLGVAALNGTGNALANDLTGNAAANTLNGGAGADILRGGGGNDIYVVDNAGDQVVEAAGQGTDTVRSSAVTNTLSANVENIVLVGGNVHATGNALNNSLTGTAGANILNGGAGNDTLIGHAGLDTLTGAAGNDLFVFDAVVNVNNRKIVNDFNVGNDTFQLDNAVFTKIGAVGGLAAAAFKLGVKATEADDRIVYNKAAGQLFYDADGSGAAARIHIATLTNKAVLTHLDFAVI